MKATAILLFAHGSRTAGWAAPFSEIRDRLRKARPDIAVELAFLEFMQPDLGAGIQRLAAGGADRIVVCPLFLGAGGHVSKDLPLLIAAARERWPGLAIDCTPTLGEAPEVLDAIAASLLQLLR